MPDLKLTEIAQELFLKSRVIDIQSSSDWDNDIFTKPWFKKTNQLKQYTSKSPGWYWISIKEKITFFKDLKCYEDSKENKYARCCIEGMYKSNLDLFGSNVCTISEQGFTIVYNGHQHNVIGRVRQHFQLNNARTGALGFNHYPLSNHEWQIRYFSESMIVERIHDPEQQKQIKKLVESKTGRVAIEYAWRMVYGWPVLCKE